MKTRQALLDSKEKRYPSNVAAFHSKVEEKVLLPGGAKRKAMMNEGGSSSQAAEMKVAVDSGVTIGVRVRDFLESEKRRKGLRVRGLTCDAFVPKIGILSFDFDFCVDASDEEIRSKASQSSLYAHLVRPLAQHVVGGHNASFIAYGPTGSGKSFTVFGGELANPSVVRIAGDGGEDPQSAHLPEGVGMLPRVINDLLHLRMRWREDSEASERPKIKLRLAVYDIRKEKVHDMLQSGRKLSVVPSADGHSWTVISANKVLVTSLSEVMQILQLVAQQQSGTPDSNSGTVAELEVEVPVTDFATRRSTLLFVECGGSEHAQLSHMTLATCIGAVVRNAKMDVPTRTIPQFRESMLTKILKGCLGGSSLSKLVITADPRSSKIQQTLKAIRFGMRAKDPKMRANIQNNFCVPDDCDAGGGAWLRNDCRYWRKTAWTTAGPFDGLQLFRRASNRRLVQVRSRVLQRNETRDRVTTVHEERKKFMSLLAQELRARVSTQLSCSTRRNSFVHFPPIVHSNGISSPRQPAAESEGGNKKEVRLELPLISPNEASLSTHTAHLTSAAAQNKKPLKLRLEESAISPRCAATVSARWIERQQNTQRRVLVAQEDIQWTGLALIATKLHKKAAVGKAAAEKKPATTMADGSPSPGYAADDEAHCRTKPGRIASNPPLAPVAPSPAKLRVRPVPPRKSPAPQLSRRRVAAPISNGPQTLARTPTFGRLKVGIFGEELEERTRIMQDYSKWVLQQTSEMTRELAVRRSPSMRIVRTSTMPPQPPKSSAPVSTPSETPQPASPSSVSSVKPLDVVFQFARQTELLPSQLQGLNTLMLVSNDCGIEPFDARDPKPPVPSTSKSPQLRRVAAPISNKPQTLARTPTFGRLKVGIFGEELEERTRIMQDYSKWVLQQTSEMSRQAQVLRRSPSSIRIVRTITGRVPGGGKQPAAPNKLRPRAAQQPTANSSTVVAVKATATEASGGYAADDEELPQASRKAPPSKKVEVGVKKVAASKPTARKHHPPTATAAAKGPPPPPFSFERLRAEIFLDELSGRSTFTEEYKAAVQRLQRVLQQGPVIVVPHPPPPPKAEVPNAVAVQVKQRQAPQQHPPRGSKAPTAAPKPTPPPKRQPAAQQQKRKKAEAATVPRPGSSSSLSASSTAGSVDSRPSFMRGSTRNPRPGPKDDFFASADEIPFVPEGPTPRRQASEAPRHTKRPQPPAAEEEDYVEEEIQVAEEEAVDGGGRKKRRSITLRKDWALANTQDAPAAPPPPGKKAQGTEQHQCSVETEGERGETNEHESPP